MTGTSGVARGTAAGRAGTQLTAREHDVLENVSDIFAELQVADRAQAIVLARDAGLGR